jgi:hypothetical protein
MERNPYAPPTAPVADIKGQAGTKIPWGRAAVFYWAFVWRAVLVLCGMCLPYLAIYPFFKLILDAWPLFEHLFRLACVLGMFAFASVLAIRWATRSSFRGYQLRILETTGAAGSSQSSLTDGFTLGRAARLFWAHLWRYVLVVLPVNVCLIWFVVGPAALTATDRITVLKVQSINLSIGFIVGIWAMREALGAAYRGFQFHWVAAESGANRNGLEARPTNAIE